MSIVSLVEVRNEAVRQIRQAIPDKRIQVTAHPGNFSETELRRLSQQTPAILTSLLKVKDGNGTDNSTAFFSSWLLYRASSIDKLYDGALNLVSILTPVIRCISAPWGYDIENVEAANLYLGSLDNINITMWAITWKWNVRGLTTDETDGGILLSDDLEFFKGYDAIYHIGNNTIQDSVTL